MTVLSPISRDKEKKKEVKEEGYIKETEVETTKDVQKKLGLWRNSLFKQHQYALV